MKKFIFMIGMPCFFSVFSSDFKKLALSENSAFRSLSEKEKSVWVFQGFTGIVSEPKEMKEFVFKKKEIEENTAEVYEETKRHIQNMNRQLTLKEILQIHQSKFAARGIFVRVIEIDGKFYIRAYPKIN